MSGAIYMSAAIYKLAHLVNNKIKTLYVFIGDKQKQKNLDKLFTQQRSNPLFNGLFSEEELSTIDEFNITVKFIHERLYVDDTIEVIKKKTLSHLMNDLNCSFDELYLFIRQYEQFNAIALYKNLTQNDKLDLTKERLLQFLLNVPELDINTLENKTLYTYSDIIHLNLEAAPMMVTKPLGQKIISLNMNTDYPYTINPFDAELYDTFLEKFADEITTTTNKTILMQYGTLINNTIYCCLAEDVLTYAADTNLSESSTLKIYYPYLNGKEITTKAQLEEKKQTLLGESREMLNNRFERNCENINLFHEIYENRTEELKFTDVGIKTILFKLLPTTAFHLPLDIVFKLIHATQDIPLIKMNLTKRQENIYRLYADRVAVNGKKIPYLDKGTIFKWDKAMGKSKSVAVFIEYYEEATGTVAPIICEFESNGAIVIKATFTASISLDALNEIIIKNVNPVITIVKDYLMQSGYTINTFVDIKNKAIEIINIDYTLHIAIEKQIKIKSIIACVSSMFNVVNDTLAQGIMLRFKRIANYNEMESQEALIVDMSNPYLGYSDADIIKALRINFQLSEEAAQTKYIEVKRAEEVMQFANRKLKTRNNPGFLTTIVKQPYQNVIMITVSGINDIGYLSTLKIYMDSLIRITQYPNSTRVAANAIKTKCKGNKTEEEKHVEEIVAIAEQPHTEPVVMNIVAEELVFTKPAADILPAATADEARATDAAVDEEIIDEDDLLARFGYGDEEEEEENPEEEEERGGAKETEANSPLDIPLDDTPIDEEGVQGGIPPDITNLNLTHPNPFSARMIKRDKKLFYTEDGDTNFKKYSRTCPWNVRRQPVIITEEEKNKIDKEHANSYSESLKYSSSPDKKLWYICPRYWSLRDNTSLRPDEVNPDEVIPKGASKVPPGKHIFEFNDYGKEHIDDNKAYITHYPGFLKPDTKGNCLPCCFKSYGGVEQTARRAQCAKEDKPAVLPTGKNKKKIKDTEEEPDEYILSHDKFPMTQYNRFGFLPLAIQKFLHTDNKKCQISELDTHIKENHTCLLRHSVEIHQTQSFVGCIADIWFRMTSEKKEKTQPTIKRMKEILIEAMSIDIFVTLQNGNLIKMFNPEQGQEQDQGQDPAQAITDMQDYAEVFSKQNSRLYQTADKTKPEQMNTLIGVAKAYTKFIDYLKDDTVTIDYTYLWDLICKRNTNLFSNGANLVILELTRTDITDNVEIICPSNHYSSSFFDPKKPVLIILKINNFYEPIYGYKINKGNELSIERYFNLHDKDILPNIKYILSLIEKTMVGKCSPLASIPATYRFEKNIPLDMVMHHLELRNYSIENQVLNYDAKVIGVVAKNKENNTKGFVPCYPSAPIVSKYNFDAKIVTASLAPSIVWMDDVYTDTYEHTKAFLEKIYNDTKRQIPCKPVIKVTEDKLIVGILTLSNQFVLLSRPTQDTFGNDLKVMQSLNYVATDTTISTSQDVDDDRINYIKKIKLETSFYNIFRNIARYLLGQFQHRDIRHEIEEKINSSQLYLKKVRSIEQLLRQLMANHVLFHEYEEKELLALNNITNCYGNGENCKNKTYCQKNDDDSECALKIPAINLINSKPNDVFYFGKLADELVRYSRIKSIVLNPDNVFTFSSLKYNLRDNEIILLQSLLTQDYFQDLIAAPVNPYVFSATYETTQPIKSQPYLNSESYEQFSTQAEAPGRESAEAEAIGREAIHDISCPANVKARLPDTSKWQKILPAGSKQILFQHKESLNTCSFQAILTILQHYDEQHKIITKNDLKEVLVKEYNKLYEKYDNRILAILNAQSKKLWQKQIKAKQLTFEHLIMREDYYATNFDMWILIAHYNVPVVFISEGKLLESEILLGEEKSKNYMVANAVGANAVGANAVGANAVGANQDYYFIKMSSSYSARYTKADQKTSQTNTLISDETNALRINSDKLRSESVKEAIRRAPIGNSLIQFIESFSLSIAQNRKKKMAKSPPAAALVEPAAPAAAAPAAASPAPFVRKKGTKIKIVAKLK